MTQQVLDECSGVCLVAVEGNGEEALSTHRGDEGDLGFSKATPGNRFCFQGSSELQFHVILIEGNCWCKDSRDPCS